MIYGAIAAGVFVFCVVLFKLMWRVAEPNEALIISGLRTDTPAGGDESLASVGF
jgi:hypothetical protein